MALIIPKNLTKAVASAGTPVQLVATQTLARDVVIQASVDNVGNVFIGDSTIDPTSSPVLGIELEPGQTLSITAAMMGMGGSDDIDLSSIYLDCDAGNTDSVSVMYLARNS
jgi:hypothetical protein